MSSTLQTQVSQSEADNVILKKKLQKEKLESTKLRNNLRNVLTLEKQKLLLTLNHHKHNVGVLNKNDDVNGDVKKVALSLLRRSMMYPTISLSLLVQYYCQHVKFTRCQEQLRKDIVKCNSRKERFYHFPRSSARKMKLLKTVLAAVTMKREALKKKMAERKRRLERDRQKLFLKMSMVFHKLRHEKQDLELIQPIITQIPSGCCERSHYNTPVQALSTHADLKLMLPKSDFSIISQPFCKIGKQTTAGQGDFRGLKVRGSEPPRDIERLKAAIPHWFPEDSLFCPFSRRSGNVPPVNSHTSITQPQREGLRHGSGYPRITPASRIRERSKCLDMPRIMELEVQSGLREAKKIVLQRMRENFNSSARSFSSSTYLGADATNRRENSPVTPFWFTKYEKYEWQEVDNNDIVTGAEDNLEETSESLQSLFSTLRSPLPPIPSPPGLLRKSGNSSANTRQGTQSPLRPESQGYQNVSISPSEASSINSSTRTTPGPSSGFFPEIKKR